MVQKIVAGGKFFMEVTSLGVGSKGEEAGIN